MFVSEDKASSATSILSDGSDTLFNFEHLLNAPSVILGKKKYFLFFIQKVIHF